MRAGQSPKYKLKKMPAKHESLMIIGSGHKTTFFNYAVCMCDKLPSLERKLEDPFRLENEFLNKCLNL